MEENKNISSYISAHYIGPSKLSLLSMYADCNKENDKEGPKFEVGGHLRIPKY